VLTTDALLSAVWGPGYSSEHHYLHVYVERLRRKLESDLRHRRFILTEPGVGIASSPRGPRPARRKVTLTGC